MKKIKIICVKGAPMNMAEEAVDRLMADILDPTAKDGEAATDCGSEEEGYHQRQDLFRHHGTER